MYKLFDKISKMTCLTRACGEMYQDSSFIARQPKEADEALLQLKDMQVGKLIISVVSRC